MARKAGIDGADQELELSSFWWLWLALFAWGPLPDISGAFDQRRRTTKAGRRFVKYARSVRFANAFFLARAYVSLALARADAAFPYSDVIFPKTSCLALGWTYVQAFSAALGLFGLLYQLGKIAEADHAGG